MGGAPYKPVKKGDGCSFVCLCFATKEHPSIHMLTVTHCPQICSGQNNNNRAIGLGSSNGM